MKVTSSYAAEIRKQNIPLWATLDIWGTGEILKGKRGRYPHSGLVCRSWMQNKH